MPLWIKHIFTGHSWGEWKLKTYSLGSYDEEAWYERECECGATEQTEVE